VVLYTGVLLAAAILLRYRPAQRAVEPALAAGVLIVVTYGISERLLPGILHFARSVSAEGRLEQPLTYWNAMGELAALGFVLSARVAGDITRARTMRAVAAAAAPPLGLGLYLSISRGALFACAAGLIVLVVVASQREQLRAATRSVVAGVLVALPASLMAGFTSLSGSASSRQREGAVMLAALVVVAAGAAAVQLLLERDRPSAQLELPRRAPIIALAVICAGLALAIVIGAKESSKEPVVTAGVSRYATLQSNRFAYWAVALRDFGGQPLNGVGAGGWAVDWLRYRKIGAFATDAHSLPLQTLAELGVVGLALLLAFLWGVAQAAARAHRSRPTLAAGAIGGFVVWLVHSPLDWDWQMPALTIVAIVLAGLLVALAEKGPGGEHR
jgi:O-Antigen ligase